MYLDHYYFEGRQAFARGVAQWENPYIRTMPEAAREWDAGYEAAKEGAYA